MSSSFTVRFDYKVSPFASFFDSMVGYGTVMVITLDIIIIVIFTAL